MNGNRGDGNKIIQFFRDLYEKVAALFGGGPPDSPPASNKGRLDDQPTTFETPPSTFSETQEDEQSTS